MNSPTWTRNEPPEVEICPFRTKEKLRLLDELLYGSERAPE
ncbi:hypothetical protein [Streptomyces sp. WM6378]|nr:hypothetical protein [Streptomyces sp. WM6378]